MASKSRFGYFSILPSHTAAITDTAAPSKHHQTDGKVQTLPRNIYSGINSTGILKKNYFSYSASAFHGSPYQDPAKIQRRQQLQKTQKLKGKQIYKPAFLNKTLVKASYQYMSEADPKKEKKRKRGMDGKVITENSNVMTSPQSKVEYLKNRQFKYIECPPPKKEQKKGETQKQKQQPFKAGSPHKQLFTSNSQAFFDVNIKKQPSTRRVNLSISHEAPFKPSCISPGKSFTALVYKQQGKGKEQVKPIKKENKERQQPFKLTKIQYNSKPTPSISLSKINLLRGYR